MLIEFYIWGGLEDQEYGPILPHVQKVFNGFTFDVPKCPDKGDRVSVVKDGLWIEATVDCCILTCCARDNGLVKENEGCAVYTLMLDNITLDDWDSSRWNFD